MLESMIDINVKNILKQSHNLGRAWALVVCMQEVRGGACPPQHCGFAGSCRIPDSCAEMKGA